MPSWQSINVGVSRNRSPGEVTPAVFRRRAVFFVFITQQLSVHRDEWEGLHFLALYGIPGLSSRKREQQKPALVRRLWRPTHRGRQSIPKSFTQYLFTRCSPWVFPTAEDPTGARRRAGVVRSLALQFPYAASGMLRANRLHVFTHSDS